MKYDIFAELNDLHSECSQVYLDNEYELHNLCKSNPDITELFLLIFSKQDEKVRYELIKMCKVLGYDFTRRQKRMLTVDFMRFINQFLFGKKGIEFTQKDGKWEVIGLDFGESKIDKVKMLIECAKKNAE